MEDQFFTLFAGLIGINNLAGTTLMSQNHGAAVNLRGPAVAIGSITVSVTDNHIITDREPAFSIGATQGLFTDNLTRPNNFVPTTIVQATNIII
ncbi:MAG: hypothetical protein WCD18_14055 [Thermosynechococcaceae cyanobacterium]